jgi:hypothetical protein
MIEKILSQYTTIKNTPDGFTIPCPFCADEGKQKEIYFYKSGIVACFRCRDLKDRRWRNSYKALQDILTKLGVDKRKLSTFGGNLNFVDFGKGVSTPIKKYDISKEFATVEESKELQDFLKERNLDPEKVKDHVFLGLNGIIKDKVCFNLYPSGVQCRSLNAHDYRIYKEKHSNLVFCADPISKTKDLFIVEAPKGALNLFQYGFSAIGCLGLSTSPFIQQIISMKEPENVYLFLDNDAAGRKGIPKLAKYLASGFYTLYKIDYPKDPEDCSFDELNEAISTAIEIDAEEIFA